MSTAADAITTAAPPPPPAPAPAAPAAPAAPPAPPAPPASPPPPPSPAASVALDPDSWQAKFLPPELATSEHVARYPSLEAFAKGAIETANWARGRVAIPKADDAVGFAEYAAKVRPANAADYAIPVPEGQSSETADFFRGKFHEVGLLPAQATALGTAWNQYQADLISKQVGEAKGELTAIELELGPAAYNQRLSAVENMFKTMGLEIDDVVPALEQVKGAGAAMRAMFAMAEKTGELAKVDGIAAELRAGNLSPEAAQAELDRMTGDAAAIAALKDPESDTSKRRKLLLTAIAQGRANGTQRKA